MNPLLSLSFLYSILLNTNKVAKAKNIIGFAISKDITLNSPSNANNIVTIDNIIFTIFIINSIPFSLRSKGTHRNENLEFEAYFLYNISREYILQSTVGGVAGFCVTPQIKSVY